MFLWCVSLAAGSIFYCAYLVHSIRSFLLSNRSFDVDCSAPALQVARTALLRDLLWFSSVERIFFCHHPPHNRLLPSFLSRALLHLPCCSFFDTEFLFLARAPHLHLGCTPFMTSDGRADLCLLFFLFTICSLLRFSRDQGLLVSCLFPPEPPPVAMGQFFVGFRLARFYHFHDLSAERPAYVYSFRYAGAFDL